MRFLLLALFLLPALGAQETKEAPAAEAAPLPPPRISSSGGVVTIRGTTSQTPRPEPQAPEAEAPAAEAPAKEPLKPAEPKPPRRVSSSSLTRDANGRSVPSTSANVVERNGNDTSSTLTIQNSNGRRVPYLTEQTREVSSSGAAKVSQKRTQRYDTAGRPTQQDLVRIEERKLPSGAIQRTETHYSENINGRMEPVERRVEVTQEKGAVTTISKQVEKPSISGSFETIIQEESVERKQGETQATRETVKKANFGGRLQVVAREESTMTKQGSVAKTETKVFEREAVSGDIALASRSVGTLEERPDGSSVERVETYGNRLAGGANNVNSSSPVLQEVLERRTTVQSDGTVRERLSVKGLSPANPDEMSAPVVTETVTKPTADGQQVRTDLYEQGVNGRMRATQSTVQQIEK